MTIPYQHNCQHTDSGWCLECVQELAAKVTPTPQPTVEMKAGVIYRTDLEAEDYNEAIHALENAKRQDEFRSSGCSVCFDSGHTAEQCHHNPLVMARRAVSMSRVWRCYHCDEVFTDHKKAEEHFGKRENERPICVSLNSAHITISF